MQNNKHKEYKEQLELARANYSDREDSKGMAYLANLELGNWLGQSFAWDWYVTLTFKDRCRNLTPLVQCNLRKSGTGFCELRPSQCAEADIIPVTIATADKAWHSWLEPLIDARVRCGHPRPHYARATEHQEHRQGRTIHYHALVGGVGDINRQLFKRNWEVNGFCHVDSYNAGRGANYYLGKYLAKSDSDLRLSRNLKVRKGGK